MIDLRPLWDFSDPERSERRFHALRCEAVTQVARTYSLRKQFDQAHANLDSIQDDPHLTGRARTFYHLERGRTFNSAGEKALAKAQFELALSDADEDLHIDALHMLAICAEDPAKARRLNSEALALAEASENPSARRWRASLRNNLGWSEHDAGEFDAALAHFEAAVALREADGNAESLHVARWCVARTYRSLGRSADALALLETLDPSDPYVQEELAANREPG